MNKIWTVTAIYSWSPSGAGRAGGMVGRSLIWLCTLLIWAESEQGAVAFADDPPVDIRLGGQQEFTCAGRPVYRRFTEMTIELDGLKKDTWQDMRLFVEVPQSGGKLRVVPVDMNRLCSWHQVGSGRIRTAVRLESPEGPVAVGPYRLGLYHRGEEGVGRLAQQSFYVTFNALDPVDSQAYHGKPEAYLSDQLQIMQKSGDVPRAYNWELDTQSQRVFELAMRTVSGTRSPEAAVQRVAEATVERLHGCWPKLTDVEGEIPSGTPQTDESVTPDVRSIAKRLESPDRRAQCYDYSAFSVALLRSAGLVATAASVVGPETMEHPYDRNRQVSWNYHVWTEVYLSGRWQGIDITYLDDDASPPAGSDPQPALQSAHNGPWFAEMIGAESRVWRQIGRELIELPDWSRAPNGPQPGGVPPAMPEQPVEDIRPLAGGR